jgi:hypothetical protein
MAKTPPLVEAVDANVTPRVDGGHTKEAKPRLEDASCPTALTPRSPRGPGCSLTQEAALDDAMSIPGSSYIVDLGAGVLGLSGYPRAPLQPTSWRQVAGGAKSTCSWVATVRRLLKETLAMVGRDVLQPARVNSRMEEEVSLLAFPLSSLGHLTPSLFWLYVQCLARDVTEVAELWEEVTRV